MINEIERLLIKVNLKYIWDEEPVFCFTSDIDWASEDVLKEYFIIVNKYNIKPTLFLTHQSAVIDVNFLNKKIERGIHPNFMNNSSHGDSYKDIVENCIKFAPEAYGFRSHRAFDVTDITHLLKESYGYKYVSNQITILQQYIRPILHESGLINFPVFFEDGTHLYNKLDLDFNNYKKLFISPGLKIISFHPMNVVFNSPSLKFMRQIKDSLTREEYNNITQQTIKRISNKGFGVGNTVTEIINHVLKNNFKILSMNELYYTINNSKP